MDLALDTDGDLALAEATGDLETVDGNDAVAQHMRIRLRFFLAEWFLNLREGIPYYRDILVKNPDRALVRRVLTRAVAETPGIDSVLRFELVINPDRSAEVSFDALLDDGAVLTFNEFVVTEDA